jgi:Domain of unknown function (DUF4340)
VRPRTLAVLAVVVLALAAFIRFYERDLPSSDERAKLAKRVLEVKKDQVERIRIVADGATVLLERQPGSRTAAPAKAADKPAAESATPAAASEWRITRPLAARADSAAVDRLLDSLVNLEKSRTLEQVVPAEVGLDRPRAEVGLTTAGGKRETLLQVGAAVPTGGETIVAVAGHPEAYVVGDTLVTDLRKKPGDWRDHQVFHGDRDRIERVSWTLGGAPRVVLAKRGDRFWLESPLVDRADRDQVEKLLSDLTGLSAETFLEAPAAGRPGAPAGPNASAAPAAPPSQQQLGLDPPRAVVEAVLAGQPQPFRVDLGATHAPPATPPPAQPGSPDAGAKLTWARAEGTAFETRTGLADTLAKPPAEWRSPLLSGLEVHQVESATLRDDHGAVQLTRAGTDWKRGSVTISYLPVSDLLFAVTEAKADRLLTPAEAQALQTGATTVGATTVGAATVGAAKIGATPVSAPAAGAANSTAPKPLLTLELRGGQAGNETLTLYPPLAGATHGALARTAGRDTVLLLPEAKLKDIQDRLAAVRAAAPLKK